MRQFGGCRKNKRQLLLGCERLESRQLLAAGVLDGFTALDDLTFVPDDSVGLAGDEASPDSDLLTDDLNDLTASGADSDDQSSDAASDAPPGPRHNIVNPLDVDVSGTLTPFDALLVIDHLNYGDPSLTQPDDDSAPGVFDTDVNGDGQITVADADQVIAVLNAIMSPVAEADRAEGEIMAAMALPPPPIPASDAALPYITKA